MTHTEHHHTRYTTSLAALLHPLNTPYNLTSRFHRFHPSHTRFPQVFDQYLSFVSLEAGLFSLGMPTSYLELNDPAAQDTHIEAAVTSVVDGLFSALVTMGVVPIIRCPKVHCLTTQIN